MISIQTDKPVAYDSPDHLWPAGTIHDNSVNVAFNRKLYELVPASMVRLLDLGCSGGGLVKSILDDGGCAVGVEGSDISLKSKRAEWATIPDYLFTADCTEPFSLFWEDQGPDAPILMDFNCITAWEFWEHIAEHQLAAVVSNIKRHLAPDGFHIGSVAKFEHFRLHQTLYPKPWWIEKFAEFGMQHAPDIEDHFQGDLVRGGYGAHHQSFSIALRAAT